MGLWVGGWGIFFSLNYIWLLYVYIENEKRKVFWFESRRTSFPPYDN